MTAAVVAVAKNEARYIREWVAYQKVIGFDCVIIYDNNSSDGTADAALELRGEMDVRVVPWPSKGINYQIDAYDHAAATSGPDFDWLAFIDCDEFIVPVGEDDIRSLLTRYEASAIALNWAMYGSSGLKSAPRGLLTENFRYRASEAFGVNRHTKMLVRSLDYISAVNPHYMRVNGRCVMADGETAAWAQQGITETVNCFETFRINHYFTKSLEEWRVKLARGYNNSSRSFRDFLIYDRNEVYDDTALKYSAALREFNFLTYAPAAEVAVAASGRTVAV